MAAPTGTTGRSLMPLSLPAYQSLSGQSLSAQSPSDQLPTGQPPSGQPPSGQPPTTTNYVFRQGSYYTDDQSDDGYGDEPSVTASASRFNYYLTSYDDSESESSHARHCRLHYDPVITSGESETERAHAQHCRLHDDPLTTYCNAMTRAHKQCSRKAKIFNPGRYPVCSIHRRYGDLKKAGNCQALEDCGHVCNRLASYLPPYHLCVKHERGTDTLPCGIMSLPTELQLMIFRYVLPQSVPIHGLSNHAGAILRVNRAFYHAASSIIYTELEFHAIIQPNTIRFLGRTWHSECTNVSYIDTKRSQDRIAARKIRKLFVDVTIGSFRKKPKGIGSHGISSEDYDLYLSRDAVRKFVDLFSPILEAESVSHLDAATSLQIPLGSEASGVHELKQLKLRPAPQVELGWMLREPEEIVAAIFFALGPFSAIGPVQDVKILPCRKPIAFHVGPQMAIVTIHRNERYRQVRRTWLKSFKKPSRSVQVRRDGTAGSIITKEYHTIEKFWQLLHERESGKSNPKR